MTITSCLQNHFFNKYHKHRRRSWSPPRATLLDSSWLSWLLWFVPFQTRVCDTHIMVKRSTVSAQCRQSLPLFATRCSRTFIRDIGAIGSNTYALAGPLQWQVVRLWNVFVLGSGRVVVPRVQAALWLHPLCGGTDSEGAPWPGPAFGLLSWRTSLLLLLQRLHCQGEIHPLLQKILYLTGNGSAQCWASADADPVLTQV